MSIVKCRCGRWARFLANHACYTAGFTALSRLMLWAEMEAHAQKYSGRRFDDVDDAREFVMYSRILLKKFKLTYPEPTND